LLKSPITSAALAAILLSTLIISTASYYWPIQEPFHAYNDGPDGCSTLLTLVRDPLLVYSYGTPIPASISVLVIIGPTVPFTVNEANVIRSFLVSGGRVLLAEDHGSGNSLLERLSIGVRFSGTQISDLYFYSKQRFFPLISQFADDPITYNLTSIVMSRPSYLQIQEPSSIKVLAQSSPLSFIDYKGDGGLMPNETTQSYPVIASARIGLGTLILVSDAATFTNGMIHANDNTKLFLNIVALSTGVMGYDLAHIPSAPLTAQRISFKNQIDAVAISLQPTPLRAIVTVAIIIGFSILFLLSVVSKKQFAIRRRDRAGNQAYILRLQAFSGRLQSWRC